MMKFNEICGYAGSGVMVTFAFSLEPVLAIVGLSLLTVQAAEAKLWNLVALNLISIGGFYSQLV